MSKFEIVATDIRSKILDGTYHPGDRLPTIPELCEYYGVSKITIKRAMDDLSQHGLVSRRRGSGTYVKGVVSEGESSRSGWLSNIEGFTQVHEARGEMVRSVVHDLSVMHPNHDVATELAMDPDEFCYRIERTRYADERALVDEVSYIALSVAPNLRRRHVESSLYHYARASLGLVIESVHRRIRATHPTPQVAARLGISVEDAVIQTKKTSFLGDGRPFQTAVSFHTPDYEYFGVEMC